MSLEQMIVEKLVELAQRPTHDALARAHANISHLEAVNARQCEDMKKMRTRESEADAPLTELWNAAEDLLKSHGTVIGKGAAATRLRAALKAAHPHVDQIPF